MGLGIWDIRSTNCVRQKNRLKLIRTRRLWSYWVYIAQLEFLACLLIVSRYGVGIHFTAEKARYRGMDPWDGQSVQEVLI